MSDVSPSPTPSAARRVVGVQFRRAAAMIYDFDAADMPLAHDACVIVETDRGEALGWTVGEPEDREPHTDGVLRRIIRLVSATDEARRDELKKREKEALRFCAQAARQRNLPMKVIAVEWAHSGEKAAFYFSSEDRIDFRELVRELAQKFRIRVEMRQVGPRDEAKIIGAMGPCGRETCCSSWMRAFTPVSIKMAKDQGLSIQPQKVTGVCGRLLCCLAYEQDTYKELRRKLPRLGKQIITPRGPGRVIDVLVLREAVRVFLDEGGPPVEFLATEVRAAGTAAPVADETDNETDAPEALTDLPATPSAPKPAPSIAARPTPAAPPRIGRDRRESRGGSGPAAPLPTIGGSAREEGGAQLPPRRDQRPPRTDGQRPQQQKREARPPRPPQGPPPNREPRPPRPEGQPNRDARPPRVEGQSPQPNREPRPPRPEGQQPQQQRPQGRPNRPPRPPPSAPAAANITPTGAASAPTEAKPAGESEGGPAREGQRNRHRNRRRGGGGGGGGGGGAPPSGGGGPPPAGPAPV